MPENSSVSSSSSSSASSASSSSSSSSSNNASEESKSTEESITSSPTTADNLAGGEAAKPDNQTNSSNDSDNNSDSDNDSDSASRSNGNANASNDSNSSNSTSDSSNSSDSSTNTDPAANDDVNISDTSEEEPPGTVSGVVGLSATVGREQVVQGVLDRAYEAGLNAPQDSYQGEIHRGTPTAYADSALSYDHTDAQGKQPEGRYNERGQHAVYGAPTQAGARAELAEYPTTDDRTYTKFDANIEVDPTTNKGGVADIHEGLRQQNLPESAVTQPSQNAPVTRAFHQLTGEHPHTVGNHVAKGAVDAGAAAINAPAAVGGNQIDMLPANADPASLTPVSRQVISPDGTVGPVTTDVAGVAPLKGYAHTVEPGPLNSAAGSGHRRSSTAHGGFFGAADAVVQAAISDKPIDATDLAVSTASNAALGSAAAKVTDAITPRLGAIKAGGAVGGVIQASVSGYTNYQQYTDGAITGERAIANTVVDTGTAVAAGATGALVGATIGSAVPVAGTAVGAVAGFAVGVGAHYAIQAVDSVTGFTETAKESIASGLESAGNWVKSWW